MDTHTADCYKCKEEDDCISSGPEGESMCMECFELSLNSLTKKV